MPGVGEIVGLGAASTGVGFASTGWHYNRAGFTLDQTLRWSRFVSGRKFAAEQTEMFREDVADLTHVAVNKLKTYGPVMTMSCGYCVTVLVEGRSGLKFPGPPTFISGLYLQCLGVGFSFFTLAAWLVFHSAFRAQVAAVQLRTRKIRVPVPTQSQLDNARKLLSTFEEQNLYDVFKLPYVMPHHSFLPEEESSGAAENGKKKGRKLPTQDPAVAIEPLSGKFPGMKDGVASWIHQEFAARDELPGASPSGQGTCGPTEPYEHFEYVREAQKDWWGAEVYNRVCMLYGMVHVLQAFAYWLVIHCMTDLALVWCAVVGSTGLTVGVFLIFRLDVLPEKGGCLPIETSAPFVAAVAIAMMYAQTYSSFTLDLSRTVAAIVLVMHILQTFRMYALAKPSNGLSTTSAKESGGRQFNLSGACDAPTWLPSSFQVVTYLVAPPSAKTNLKKPKQDQSKSAPENASANGASTVDMTPWYYTRIMIIVTLVGWLVLLTGRIVEAVMGERMLTTNPGAPPWTRRGLWYGWEFGPVTSKHYAHVTPQRGHYAWDLGWGPHGQQELWPSDLFGFHPEADMWWREKGVDGAAFHGENTWAPLRIKYGTKAELHAAQPGHVDHSHHTGKHLPTIHNYISQVVEGTDQGGEQSQGSHRRLRGEDPGSEIGASRPLVPVAVRWPALLEPEMVACGPQAAGAPLIALTANGFGAFVPADAAAGRAAADAVAFSLRGLGQLGRLLGLSWTESGLIVVTSSGSSAKCASPRNSDEKGNQLFCQNLLLPALPLAKGSQKVPPAVVFPIDEHTSFRAVVADLGGKMRLLQAGSKDGLSNDWVVMGEVSLPSMDSEVSEAIEIASISANSDTIVVTTSDGAVHYWPVADFGGMSSAEANGRHETPIATRHSRTWRAACRLSEGKVVRLASTWRKLANDVFDWHPELLI